MRYVEEWRETSCLDAVDLVRRRQRQAASSGTSNRPAIGLAKWRGI